MGRRGSETEQTGNIGETAVTLEFQQLQWHVAPNPAGEVGTDLLLQARDARRFDLGAIVGAQVKSGPSFFDTPESDDAGDVVGWWFRDPNGEYLKYWRDHTVPHIVVLHDASEKKSYWVHVTADRIKSTGKGAKILVPKASVVDAEHADELFKVATVGRVGPRWEGSAWDEGGSILSPDQLRYALLTPRLIAPHPNRPVDELRPDQAIALLVKMRLHELDPTPLHKKKGAVPDLAECRTSKAWRWQFYAALHDVLIEEKGREALEALIETASKPHESAAAAVFACAMRVESQDPLAGLALVERVLTEDKCDPIDHDWLLLHKSRCLVELGELEEARRLAFEVQRLRTIAPQDPTAMAIAGSGADIIFTAGKWSSDLSQVITGRDTLAAWWRGQEVAWGLQNHFDDHFNAWAQGSTPTGDAGDDTWLKLRTASLLASTAADHSSWRHTSGLRAQHILTFTAGDQDDIIGALTLLRRVGDSKTLKKACHRLLQSGPAAAVRAAASLVNLEAASTTSIRADLQLIADAADVLETETADVHSRWILSTLADVAKFKMRFKPNFYATNMLLETLRVLVQVVSPTLRRELIDTVLALPPQTNKSTAHDWANVVAQIPDDAWTDDDRRAIFERRSSVDVDSAEHPDAPENPDVPDSRDAPDLRNVFDRVLADRDQQNREALEARIREGDLGALRAFGDIRDLDQTIVQKLLENLSAQLDQQIEELQGLESPGHEDFFATSTDHEGYVAGTLVLINAWHPSAACWAPIVRLLSIECPFADHLRNPLKKLRQVSRRLPPEIADTLIEPLRLLMLNGVRNQYFFGIEDVRGEAAAALVAIRPSAISDQELWDLMTADTSEQRQAAVRLIAARGVSQGFDTLWAMSRDSDPWVRAAIANQVAVAASQTDTDDRFLPLLMRLLSSEGTLVARLVAVDLKRLARSDNADKLAEVLRDNISSEVRRAVASYDRAITA
ncbi:DUF4365 domain-containing protein (plasmid) [Rhodococcus opacus]|uniref:DUF4365 domain-containing protein n=1 Tax=Rhodococcus opacus TaxID=37919 RepID=UPI0034D2EC5D